MSSLFRNTLFLLLPVVSLLSGQAQESGVKVERDMVYKKGPDFENKMDLYIPTPAGKDRVAIVYFHGGGWQKGKKTDPQGRLREFASNGVFCVSVQYRFAPQFKFPSQVEDAKDAVRFVRSHAAEWNIDPNKIVSMGDSAGGYLAMMLGVTRDQDGFKGQLPGSAAVQGVVNFYGGVDLRKAKPLPPEAEKVTLEFYGKDARTVLSDFTGTTDPKSPILEKIAVTTYIDSTDAPILSFYGDKDPFGGEETARSLHEAFRNAGVKEQLVIVSGGGHGNWGPARNHECNLQVLQYLKQLFP